MTPEPWRSGKVLLHEAGSGSHSIGDLFRRHTDPSWQLLIEYRYNGKYRLRLTDISNEGATPHPSAS